MTKHNSNIFQFDKSATELVYNNQNNHFQNDRILTGCLPLIQRVLIRHHIDVGVDFEKPWEVLLLPDHFQIEYLLVGRLESKIITHISDDEIGINVFEERMFGKQEFGTEELLNLTLIIDKDDVLIANKQ